MVRYKQKNPKKNINPRRIMTRSQTKRFRNNNDNIKMPSLKFKKTKKVNVKTGINMNKRERLYQGGKSIRTIEIPQTMNFTLDEQFMEQSTKTLKKKKI